ncbi:transmembrane protein 223-like [Oscarella lobularis]|uniref:transmembrane protein 223-like n=1 Tax=Oscarella lobularis TaxID=121494 RepID=UPI0033140542
MLVVLRRFLTDRNSTLLLYEHDRSRFFRLVGLASLSQLGFWFYTSHLIATELRPWNRQKDAAKKTLAPLKWRMGLAAASASAGVLIAASGLLYAHRSVKRLEAVAGRSALRLTTHGFLTRPLHVSVRDIRIRGGESSRQQLTIKVKGKLFFYLLDTSQGQIANRRLLNDIIASQRVWS